MFVDLQANSWDLRVSTGIQFHPGSALNAPPALVEHIDFSRKLKYLNVEGDRCCMWTGFDHKKHACGWKDEERALLSARIERQLSPGGFLNFLNAQNSIATCEIHSSSYV